MGCLWNQVPPATKRRLAWAGAGSVVVPWIGAGLAKTAFQPGLSDNPERVARFIDILAIGAGVFALSMVFTVALGCVLVAAMKGPIHLGDPFPGERP